MYTGQCVTLMKMFWPISELDVQLFTCVWHGGNFLFLVLYISCFDTG